MLVGGSEVFISTVRDSELDSKLNMKMSQHNFLPSLYYDVKKLKVLFLLLSLYLVFNDNRFHDN